MNKKHTFNLFAFTLIFFVSLSAMEEGNDPDPIDVSLLGIEESFESSLSNNNNEEGEVGGEKHARDWSWMDIEGGDEKKSQERQFYPESNIFQFNGQEISISDVRFLHLKGAIENGALQVNQKIPSEKYNPLTPLMIASQYMDPRSVEFILEQPGIMVDMVDYGGRTALMHAAGTKALWIPQTIQILLDHGASPTQPDLFGNTALSIAENRVQWRDPQDRSDKSGMVVNLLRYAILTSEQQ